MPILSDVLLIILIKLSRASFMVLPLPERLQDIMPSVSLPSNELIELQNYPLIEQ
jgi:hypothetical protein